MQKKSTAQAMEDARKSLLTFWNLLPSMKDGAKNLKHFAEHLRKTRPSLKDIAKRLYFK